MTESKDRLALPRWCAVGTLLLSAVICWSLRASSGIAAEHGPLENIQALCLIAGTFVLWLQARAVTDVATKHALELASLGYITMFLLEFDVRPFKIPPLTWLLNGPVRNLWLGGLWLYCLGRAARMWRRVLQKGIFWLQSTAGAVMTLSALCWIAGAAVDRLKPFSTLHNFFAEEFIETQAALLMLWGAAELVHLAGLERFAPSALAALTNRSTTGSEPARG